MNRDEFLNRLKQDMINNIGLMPEIPLPDLTHLLFGTLNVHTSEIEKTLISLRELYGIDHMMAIPEHKRSMSIRFWLMKNKDIPLLEAPDVQENMS